MKKSDEIKKGLEYCMSRDCAGAKCPYFNAKSCNSEKTVDTLAYIQQLESKVKQAVEDFRKLGSMGANICPVCAHYNRGAGCPDKCPNALKEDCFEWRGTVTREG